MQFLSSFSHKIFHNISKKEFSQIQYFKDKGGNWRSEEPDCGCKAFFYARVQLAQMTASILGGTSEKIQIQIQIQTQMQIQIQNEKVDGAMKVKEEERGSKRERSYIGSCGHLKPRSIFN